VVKSANRPAKPEPQANIDYGFDDKLWSLIEECWSQEPSNRPTAATVSSRLGDVNCYSVKPAEMYKKEIADLTAELARVKESSKAARQDFETELARLRDSLAGREREQAELKKDLDEERELLARREQEKAELKKDLDEGRDLLAKREQEKAELKKDLDDERDLRKRLEKNADRLPAQSMQSLTGSIEGHLTGHHDDVLIA
jgi:chromosome segregation ATPase